MPKTQQMHCVIAKGHNKVMVAETSDASEFSVVSIRDVDSSDSEEEPDSESVTGTDFTIGQWVVVQYEERRYPGEVTNYINKELQVTVMHRSGQYWKLTIFMTMKKMS